MATQTGVSLRPSTFAAGGSLVDDVDVTFTRLRFGFGYGGQGGSGEEAVTLHTTMIDGDGTEHIGYYSCGNGFVPSEAGDENENGKFLVPVGDKTAPNGGSNFALLINSFVNAGLPEDLLDSGDISALEGTKAHVNRVPEPKRGSGVVRQGKNADQPRTVLLVTTIVSLPGEAPTKGKPAAKPVAGAKPGAAKPAAKAEPAEAPAIVEELDNELGTIFMGQDIASAKKVDLVKLLFSNVDKTQANRKELMTAAAKDEILNQLTSFTYDGKMLTLNQ